ncbi:MAG: 6-hydroxymethylpterin diphosphokinase MptE-like protein [Bacillota bacterium]
MDLYNINLAAFRARYPDLVSSLEKADSNNCSVVDAKNGMPTLKVLFEGKEVFAHSAYDPQKEARRWADEVKLQPGDMLIVFGFGLGYHITELIKTAAADVKIIVIEPNPAFLNLAFRHLQLADLISSEKIYLVLGHDVPALKRVFFKFVDLYRLDKVKTASYLPLLRNFADAFQPYQQTVYDELLFQYVNISTVLYFSYQWTKNFFANLKDTIISPGVSTLFGKFVNKPAILVSAGPSLTKNIHLLNDAKNKAFILCVGSALRVLLKEGIIPDLVVSVDGSEANYKHFQGLPEHRIPLVFDPVLHHKILEEYKGPKFITLCSDLVLQCMGYFLEENKGNLKIGPSVASVSLDLLKKTGANPIVFVGQDLAYTGGVSHANGTSHTSKTLEDLKREDRLLEVDGIDGGKVLTDRSFYTFLRWFESYIAGHPETTFINATEGGAKIAGTRNLPLKNALAEYCTQETDYGKILAEIQEEYQRPSASDIANAAEKLWEIRKQVKKIKKTARRGLKKSEALAELYEKGLPDLKDVKKILKSLNKIDRDIREEQQGMEMVSLLFQPYVQALRQISDREIPEESEREQGRRISSESVLLYFGIHRVVTVADELIGDAIQRFKDE